MLKHLVIMEPVILRCFGMLEKDSCGAVIHEEWVGILLSVLCVSKNYRLISGKPMVYCPRSLWKTRFEYSVKNVTFWQSAVL